MATFHGKETCDLKGKKNYDEMEYWNHYQTYILKNWNWKDKKLRKTKLPNKLEEPFEVEDDILWIRDYTFTFDLTQANTTLNKKNLNRTWSCVPIACVIFKWPRDLNVMTSWTGIQSSIDTTGYCKEIQVDTKHFPRLQVFNSQEMLKVCITK